MITKSALIYWDLNEYSIICVSSVGVRIVSNKTGAYLFSLLLQTRS